MTMKPNHPSTHDEHALAQRKLDDNHQVISTVHLYVSYFIVQDSINLQI
jgi:hypothetical protein